MFTHLHVHSHYSLLDGLPQIDGLISKAKEYNMASLALTDHGVMYGIIEFYKKCRDQGIKPILGMEVYIALAKMADKRPKIDNKRYHLTLLAKNIHGYKNLIKLTSLSHLEGFYYKPRVDKEILKKYSDGIIALSGCLTSELSKTLLYYNIEKGIEVVKEYQEIFGKENYFLEITHIPKISESVKVREMLIEVHKRTGIPIIATNDVHYLNIDDKEAQDALICVQTGKKVTDDKRLNMKDVDAYFMSEEEMRQNFSDIPKAVDNTQLIVEKCNVELSLDNWVFPKYNIPKGTTDDGHLRERAFDELPKQLGRAINQEEKERLEYELDIIKAKGYSPYFLVVSDYAKWSRENGIIYTTRGSAAGSLVCYAIGITIVNPLDYRLPFERFLNPYRPSPPDIDMDFEDSRRDEVLDYCKQKYGYGKIAQIVTFGTMKARAAVRDIGRVLDYEYSFCDYLAKTIPHGKQGFPMTLKRALEESADLKQLYDTDKRAKKILDLAQKVEGCARHASVHAAGVVISPSEITDFTPIQKETGGEKVITQYDMHAVESAGLLKMDFLGIRNLSILGNAVKIVRRTRNEDVDIWDLPLDDEKVWSLLARGETMGLFQLSSSGMTKCLMDLKPTSIFDLMAIISLYRPGPIDSIRDFVSRKHDPSLIKYMHPKLEPILDRSYGIITYQDDVLLIAIQLAGYTWEEADKFRKAIGKKIPEEMMAQKEKFLLGIKECSGFTDAMASEMWRLVEPFAAYGFNKSHAASYAIISYQTAYMKSHFPTEFMAALMTAECEDDEKISSAVSECHRMGVEVLPPDANESFARFTVVTPQTAYNKAGACESKIIRFGLRAVKNIGAHIVDVIISERKANGPYKNLADFLKRVQDKDLNKKSLESFIKCGALDRFGERARLLYNMDKLLSFAKTAQRDALSGQESLFGGASKENDGGELVLEMCEEADNKTKLSWEKDLLGLYISSHPLMHCKNIWKQYAVPLKDITEHERSVRVVGMISSVKSILTKKNDPMLFVTLEDITSSVEIVVFPSVFQKSKDIWEEDRIVIVDGRISTDRDERKILASDVRILTERILDRVNKESEALPDKSQAEDNSKAEFAPVVTISLPVQFYINKINLKELKQAILRHKGEHRVQFVLEGPARKIIKTNIKVDLNPELLEKVSSLIGKDKIVQG